MADKNCDAIQNCCEECPEKIVTECEEEECKKNEKCCKTKKSQCANEKSDEEVEVENDVCDASEENKEISTSGERQCETVKISVSFIKIFPFFNCVV